jgi:hypothetical protein
MKLLLASLFLLIPLTVHAEDLGNLSANEFDPNSVAIHMAPAIPSRPTASRINSASTAVRSAISPPPTPQHLREDLLPVIYELMDHPDPQAAWEFMMKGRAGELHPDDVHDLLTLRCV